MSDRIRKMSGILLGLLCLLSGMPQSTTAQSPEEMEVLRLFYKEKDLVVSPTRHPKPIPQVAENITIVTAAEIEAMNAHSVAEILNRVTGMFVRFNQDFGATSLLQIQSSEERHVRVLLDGITWNFLSGGQAETNSIPVGIIERIEIIKGPASSTWGASLGGIVNIITKKTGKATRPSGAVRASYGEQQTQDYRAQISGLAGPVGYYLFAGHQDSDGLRNHREFETDSLYGKLQFAIGEQTTLGLTMGYAEPDFDFGEFRSHGFSAKGDIRSFFTAGSLQTRLSPSVQMNLGVYSFDQKETSELEHLSPKERLQKNRFDEQTIGANGQLAWSPENHTVVLGMTYDHGELEQKLRGISTLKTDPRFDEWAAYVNDTLTLGKWTVTPGMRYDYSSLTGAFVSPSLGLTYALAEHSLLRAYIGRGFATPPLVNLFGGERFAANRSLDEEKIWSFQAGAESTFLKYLWLKTAVFYHDVDDAFEFVLEDGDGAKIRTVNGGDMKRRGVEIEAQTLPFHHVTLLTGFAYVNLDPANTSGSRNTYQYNIGIRYDDRQSFKAELFGHYLWWDFDSDLDAEYDDFIWDLDLTRRVLSTPNTSTELFFSAHNLFNGSLYPNGNDQNPRRWVEGGIRFRF